MKEKKGHVATGLGIRQEPKRKEEKIVWVWFWASAEKKRKENSMGLALGLEYKKTSERFLVDCLEGFLIKF